MTQHPELIDQLRQIGVQMVVKAATALEAQAREIAELKAQLAATAKSAFEAMPHDIPQRIKDTIYEETGWSGSMVSRMYTELRKAFTGEPYKANEDLDAALLEVEALRAKESELYTLYGLAEAECRRLRRVFTYKNQPGNVEAWRFGEACRAAQPGGDPIDHGLSLLQKLQEKGYGIVAIRALNTEGEGNDRP